MSAPADRKREAALMREIQAAIGSMEGVICHRNNVGTALFNGARVEYGVGGKGAPDLVCEVMGADDTWRLLWIEVKTPDGTVEKHQAKWHETARGMGRECAIARCVEDAIDAVENVKSGLVTLYDRSNGQARCEGE